MSRLLFRRPVSPVGLILLLAVCTLCLRPLDAMDEKKPNPADSVAARESGLPPAGGAGADAASKVSPSVDWTSRASEEIQRSEYFFSRQDDGSFAAPNRAHDLRVRLDASALRVSSRTKGANP